MEDVYKRPKVAKSRVAKRSKVANHSTEELPPRNKSFLDFLRLLYATFLEPLFSILAWFFDRGYLLGCSLTQWVKVRITKQAPAHRNKKVKSSDLKCGRFLGEGCSGIIYEATWSRGRNISLLARKAFPAVPADVFENEATLLVELDHPNVVKVLGWTVDRRSCSLVMEHMKYDLYSVVQKRKEAMRNGAQLNHEFSSTVPIPLREAVHIMLQIAEGMKYVHEQGLAHGDLKPNNVLVDSESDLMLVKVSDFGLTETKKRSTSLVSHQARCLQILKWKAPELFEGLLDSSTEDSEIMWTEMFPELEVVKTSHASSSETMGIARSEMQQADVYCFALTCSYILGAQVPYESNLGGLVELRNGISSGARPLLPSGCPEALTSLISECWDPTPWHRPPFFDICEKMRTVERELKQIEGEAWEEFQTLKAEWGHFFFDFNGIGLEIKGAFAQRSRAIIYEGEWRTDDGKFHPVAIKAFKTRYYRITKQVMHFFNSKGTKANLRKSRVLRPLGGTLLKNGSLALVYERFWGDLRKLIDLQMLKNKDIKMPPFKQELAIEIMLQIAKGLVELHKFGIMHRDVKAANVLVHDLEKFSTGGNHGLISCALIGYEDQGWGTGFWRAPEIEHRFRMGDSSNEFTPTMDVYSYGMTCYEILTGQMPFDNDPPIGVLWPYMGTTLLTEFPASADPQLRNLLQRCLHADPSMRLDPEHIVWILKSIQEEDLLRQLPPLIEEFVMPMEINFSVWRR